MKHNALGMQRRTDIRVHDKSVKMGNTCDRYLMEEKGRDKRTPTDVQCAEGGGHADIHNIDVRIWRVEVDDGGFEECPAPDFVLEFCRDDWVPGRRSGSIGGDDSIG